MPEPYSVSSEVRYGVEIFTLSHDGVASAEIAPSLGNNCFSFGAPEPVLEPIPFEEFCKKPTSYGIPILFPYPNRITDGRFSFQGREYTVAPNRHGFVRDKAWTVMASGASEEEGAWLTSGIDASQYAEQILQQFPFPFRVEVTYRLKDRTLSMETLVRNVGADDMPFGFGIHPYFVRPDEGTLQIPAQKRWELSDALPTGNLLDVADEYDLRQPRDVRALVLDDIYTDLIADSDGWVLCSLDDHTRKVRIVVESEAKPFPHIVAYTAPTPRKALCIEPYTCPTDGFNLQSRGIESNLLVLRPEEERHFTIRMRRE